MSEYKEQKRWEQKNPGTEKGEQKRVTSVNIAHPG
jgi:hypothetical protein